MISPESAKKASNRRRAAAAAAREGARGGGAHDRSIGEAAARGWGWGGGKGRERDWGREETRRASTRERDVVVVGVWVSLYFASLRERGKTHHADAARATAGGVTARDARTYWRGVACFAARARRLNYQRTTGGRRAGCTPVRGAVHA